MSACEFDEKLPERFDNEKVIVQGILDCAFEEDGEIVVADYKTDVTEREEELIQRYKVQLNYYAEALEKLI